MDDLSPLDRLRECEAVINRTKKSAWDFVRALKEIKDDGLWHEAVAPPSESSYVNFDDYAQRRFGFGRNYANRLIKGLEIQVAMPIGTDLNESQARALGKVPTDDRQRVYEAAKEFAGDGPVTAKLIAEAAQGVKESEEEGDEDDNDHHSMEAEFATEDEDAKIVAEVREVRQGDEKDSITADLVRLAEMISQEARVLLASIFKALHDQSETSPSLVTSKLGGFEMRLKAKPKVKVTQ